MAASQIMPVILAGGSGERLWPLSRLDYPKQFISLEDAQGRSLFQRTLLRLADRSYFTAPLVVCNHAHRFIAAEHLRSLGIDDAVLVVEPVARGTAPALALAALHATQAGPDVLLFVVPSDHAVADEAAFHAAVVTRRDVAAAGRILTFGITPTAPETGYGYIARGDTPLAEGVYPIARFIEKPDSATASALLAEGRYSWNSGMFLLSAHTALEALAQHAPALLAACRDAYQHRTQDGDFLRPAPDAFAQCPAGSIDELVMERTVQGAVMPVTMGWSDLGTWSSLYAQAAPDARGNRLHGHVMALESDGCYLHSERHFVAALGVRDLVVVAAEDAVLVGARAHMPQMKDLLAQMRSKYVAATHRTAHAHRPWGSFARLDSGDGHQVKKLHVAPGAKISLQSHTHRAEHWVVVSGRATVTYGTREQVLEAGQSVHIPAGVVHRLANHEAQPLVVIEVQTGAYLGEDDIARFEDDYNRAEA